MICAYVLRCVICLDFTGQIPGTTPTIPGMFPNMFPLASGQVHIPP